MSSSKFIKKIRSMVVVTSCSALLASGILYYQNDERFFANFLMPMSRLIFNADKRNKIGIFLCKWNLIPKNNYRDSYLLSTNLCGIELNNVVGLSAGFDRNGEAIKGLHSLGFSFLEVGTITPQEEEDGNESIRYNTNNKGQSFIVPKMRLLRRREEYKGVIGFNIGKNFNSSFLQDVTLGVKVFSPVANYLVINIESQPFQNSSDDLKQMDNLRKLLKEVNEARLLFDVEKQRPIFLKLSPELNEAEIKNIIDVTNENKCKVHGFIISNTSLNESDSLKDKSTKMIEHVYKLTNGKCAIIGVGGICDGKDAYQKILAGASAIQIYSSFLNYGPPIINKIKRELSELLLADGYENVSDAVGKSVQLQKKRFSWNPFFWMRN